MLLHYLVIFFSKFALFAVTAIADHARNACTEENNVVVENLQVL